MHGPIHIKFDSFSTAKTHIVLCVGTVCCLVDYIKVFKWAIPILLDTILNKLYSFLDKDLRPDDGPVKRAETCSHFETTLCKIYRTYFSCA